MKSNTFVVLICLAVICGCASPGGVKDDQGRIRAGDSSKITLGMTKLQVMQALGKPEATEADSSAETLIYRLERPWWQDRPFQVKLQDGKVVLYQVVEKKD